MIPILILTLIVLIIVLPIASFVRASNASRQSEQSIIEIVRLKLRIDSLEQAIKHLKQPEEPADLNVVAIPNSAPIQPPTMAVATEHTPPPLPKLPPPILAVEQTAPPLPPPLAEKNPPVPSASTVLDLERFMGIKLFAWAGGLLLFVSVALFLKYAIEQNLFPPSVRVAGGYFLGIGLIVAGVRLNRIERYKVLAQTLCATGTVVSYGVTFAAHDLYHLPMFSVGFAFGVMVCITLIAFIMAAQMDAIVIAVLGMVGGFLTPALINSGQDRPVALFSYIAALNAGLIALTIRKRWDFLVTLGAIGTAIFQIGWSGRWLQAHAHDQFTPWGPYSVYLLFPLLFLVAPVLLRAKLADSLHPSIAVLLTTATGLLWSFVDQSSAGFDHHLWVGYAFLFSLSVIAMTVAALQPRLLIAGAITNALTFLHLALWTHRSLTPDRMYSALTLYTIAAALPAGLIWLKKKFGETSSIKPQIPIWPSLIGQASLCALAVHWENLPASMWITVMFLSAVNTVLCTSQKQSLGIFASAAMTLVTLGIWIQNGHPSTLTILGLLAIFTVLHAVGSILTWTLQRESPSATEGDIDARTVPVSTVWMPFGLLAYAVTQMNFEQPSALFLVVLFLCIAMLWLAEWMTLPLIVPTTASSALVVLSFWHWRSFDPAHPWIPLLWYTAVHAVFSLVPWKMRRTASAGIYAWATAAAISIPFFGLTYQDIKVAFPSVAPGLFPALFAIPSLIALRFAALHPNESQRTDILAWYAGVALFFITLIFPIQFDHEAWTLGWALEGAALCWLVRRIDHPALSKIGLGLIAIAFMRLALNPEVLSYHVRSGLPVWNWYLYTYLIAAASCAFAAKELPLHHTKVGEIEARPVLWSFAGVLLFCLLNIEIADAFTPQGQRYVLIEFGGNFARSMTYSIAWGLFALVLIIVGLWKRSAGTRYAGIALLVVTLAKLFLHDLASIGQLYRIGAFFIVAVIALTASWLYQRFLQPEK